MSKKIHAQKEVSAEKSIKCISCMNFDCKKCIDVGRKLVFGQAILMLCNCTHVDQFKE